MLIVIAVIGIIVVVALIFIVVASFICLFAAVAAVIFIGEDDQFLHQKVL